MGGGGVFAVGLVVEYGAVGAVVGGRAADLAEVEAAETALALEFALLLVVDVEQVKLAGAVGEGGREMAQQAAHYGRAEGVEEEADAGAGRETKLRGVAQGEAQGGDGAAGFAPLSEVAAGNAGEGGMKLNAEDLTEGLFRGEEHGAPHAGADVDEGELLDGFGGAGALPAGEERGEDRRGYAIVGGGVAIVAMAGLEVAAGDESAGTDAVGFVKRVAEETGGFGEAGETNGHVI